MLKLKFFKKWTKCRGPTLLKATRPQTPINMFPAGWLEFFSDEQGIIVSSPNRFTVRGSYSFERVACPAA